MPSLLCASRSIGLNSCLQIAMDLLWQRHTPVRHRIMITYRTQTRMTGKMQTDTDMLVDCALICQSTTSAAAEPTELHALIGSEEAREDTLKQLNCQGHDRN